MKRIALAICVIGLISNTCRAQHSDGCQAPPAYCPPECSRPSRRSMESPRGLETPRGAYVRAPETGEQAGESTGYGLHGLGFRLPAISIDFPEIRLPRLTKYRRLPEMFVEGSRAPWVENRALEFNQVSPREVAPENPRALDTPPSDDSCVPPMPCVDSVEDELRNELVHKDEKIERIQAKLNRLEAILERLADSEEKPRTRSASRPTPTLEPSHSEPSLAKAARGEDLHIAMTERRPPATARNMATPRPYPSGRLRTSR